MPPDDSTASHVPRRLPDRAVPATGTGSSRSTGPIATLAMDVAEDGGLRPGYKLKLNSLRPRRRHRARRRAAAHPLRAPGGARGGRHQRQGARVLLGRQHLHARAVRARVEGELLQVHQRDAQRHRGREPPLGHRASSPRSTARARAAATSSRSRATRSCSSTTAARRCRCPRCRCSACCPAPAASRASPTSARCGTTSPTSSARSTEGVRGKRAVEWRLVDAIAKPGEFARVVRERAMALAGAQRPARRRRRASRCRRSSGAIAPDGLALPPRRRRHRPRAADRDVHRARAAGPAARATSRGSRRRARAGGRSRWRASSTTRSCRCARNELDIGTWLLDDRRATRRRVLAADAALERHAEHWFVRETIGLLRRTLARLDVTVAHAVRADRAAARASPARCSSWRFAADRTYMLRAARRARARAAHRAVRRELRRAIRW